MAPAEVGNTRRVIIALDDFFRSTISMGSSGGYDLSEHWNALGCAGQLEALTGHE
jgi:hypothetical protein